MDTIYKSHNDSFSVKKRAGRGTSFLFLSFLSLLPLHAQTSPKHEVRVAWITAVYGLNWPRTKATTPTGIRWQEEELIDILDRLKEANFSTVFFQTRARGDVLYRLNIEPFNSILTGEVDGDPGYGPLAFAIGECHKRGMECHARMVTIPLGGKRHVALLGEQSVTKHQRDVRVPYKNEYFLNPGHPITKEYLTRLIREVISRYDVDGVHFDYPRHPENAPRFPDSCDSRRYSKGRSLVQWCRDNLTDTMRYIYSEVEIMEPQVKASICLVGKCRDTSRYSSKGWNALLTVYQDPQGWLGEDIQDQIYPTIYFRGNGFYPFALDWQEQSNGRHIVPGLGVYFLRPDEGNWTSEKVECQIYFIRANHLTGETHYRVKYLMDNTQEVYDILREQFYRYPALQSLMPWIDNATPTALSGLNVASTDDGYTRFSWKVATDNDRQNVPMHIIYASDIYPVGITNPENILVQNLRDMYHIYAPIRPWMARKYFAIMAVDCCGNESEACR